MGTMFATIQANQYSENSALLDQMFRLRKQVFVDTLNWDIPAQGSYERDEYDDCFPVYLVWFDRPSGDLIASIRLMPTTGPSLLNDVFRSTYPETMTLSAPGIWEATRACFNNENLRKHAPDISPTLAFCHLMLAIHECAFHHGIHTFVTNYEPHLARIYKKSGARFDEIGRSSEFGDRPVCCGVFDVSRELLSDMQTKLGTVIHVHKDPKHGTRQISAERTLELAS